MKMIALLCAVIAGVTLAFAQAPVSKSLSAFDQALVSREKGFLQAMQDKNAASVSQIVSDDFEGIATNGDFYEKEELLSAAQEGLPKDFRIYDLRIMRLNADCAVVTYNNIVPGAHPRYRHVSHTWTREGGEWKLRFEQETPNLWSAADLD
jgi:hypothetical protein